ncbi:putative symport protein [Escherichia coli]|uniref:Putative symport protein n=1 Tax=Escherichia coli TaxID=562 RepID=A0A376VKR3_ECOLX|nr:putative symport protein [Escherichia coli]
MKKISLTTMILLALVLGMIIGVVLNNTASPETAKLYAQEISIFTTIFLRTDKNDYRSVSGLYPGGRYS